MFKMFITILAISVILFGSNITSTTIHDKREAKVDQYAKLITKHFTVLSEYLAATGDYTPTRSEVQQETGLKNHEFTNYVGEECELAGEYCGDLGGITYSIDIDTGKITLGGILDGANDKVKELFLKNEYVEPEYRLSSDYATIAYTVPSSVTSILKLSQAADADPTKSFVKDFADLPATGDSSITYQVLDGNGGVTYYKWDDAENKYYTIGGLKPGSYGEAAEVWAISIEEILEMSCTQPTNGYVNVEGVAKPYVCETNGKFIPILGSSADVATFSGTGTVLSIATTLFDRPGKSDVTAAAPNGEWGGPKIFIKSDYINQDGKVDGYWMDDTGTFAVFKTIDTLHELRDLFATGSTVWIPNSNNTDILKLVKRDIPGVAENWVFVAQNYADVLAYTDTSIAGDDGKYIYITDYDEYVYYNTDHFVPIGSAKTYITSDINARNVFSPVQGYRYLSQVNDCDEFTCNGAAVDNYYSGSQLNGLYVYNYSDTGKYKNYLTDVIPYDSWAQLWIDQPSAALWNGADFGEVPSGAILTKDTLNGSVVYSYNGNYINKTNGFIIPQNKLPAGMNAEDAVIVQFNSKNWVTVPDFDTFVTDTNLGVGYTVNLTGSGYTNLKVERCENYDDDSHWNDNCSDPSDGSTFAHTNGSRSDLPPATNSTRKNFTKQLNYPTEDNYTTTGVIASNDAGSYEWFYSLTGTTTSNLLDNPCLTRTKDGLSLSADFVNSQCYIKKATNVNIFKEWHHFISGYMGGNHHTATTPEWIYRNPRDICTSDTTISGSSWSCRETSRTYTCDIDWLKLDNSTCEYRESF